MSAQTLNAAVPTRALPSWLKIDRKRIPTLASVVIFLIMIIYGQAAYGQTLTMSTASNLLINTPT